MRLIGLLDGTPVFEFKRGKYVAVIPDSERWMVMWCWFGHLGRNCDTFTKCTQYEHLDKSIEIIEKNKEIIEEELNDVCMNSDTEFCAKVLDEQDTFYNWLEENRTYNWFEGYEDKTN